MIIASPQVRNQMWLGQAGLPIRYLTLPKLAKVK